MKPIYLIKTIRSGDLLTEKMYSSLFEAIKEIQKIPGGVDYYEISTPSLPEFSRIIKEGFFKGDLAGIMVPRVSVDEYVAQEGRVVIALFVQNVPEAAEALENFFMTSDGVVDTDSSDSEVDPTVSIIYIELEREGLDINDIHHLVEEAAMIGGFEVGDFRMITLKSKTPYSKKALKAYFGKNEESEESTEEEDGTTDDS